MVIELIKSMANQVIRDRLIPYGGTARLTDQSGEAMILAAGFRSAEVVGELMERTPKADTSLTYLKSVMFGLNPVYLRSSNIGFKNPYKTDDDYGLSDPLHIAAFYASYGSKGDAEQVLLDRLVLTQSYHRWREAKSQKYFVDPILNESLWGEYWTHTRRMHRTWVVPDYESLGLTRVVMETELDNFYLEGAFQREEYVQRLKAELNPHNIETFAMISGLKHRRLDDSIRRAAYDQARKLTTNDKGGSFRYADMATYVRLCAREDASALFDEVRGARQMVALFRHDTSELHFVRGLRQLAQAAPGVRKEILERLGRAPTVAEIRDVRSSGIISILDEMSWDLLEPIIDTPGLRAAALPFAEKLGPTTLRRFLTDHPGRVKRIPNIATEADVAGTKLMVTQSLSIADWKPVMSKLHKMHQTSNEIRDELLDITESRVISFLALLKPFKASTPDIDAALRSHPRWKHIEELLKGYEPPKLAALWE